MNTFRMLPKYYALALVYNRLVPNPEEPVIELHQEGWYNLVHDTMHVIDREIEYMPEDLQGGIHIRQMKSKFGGLRIHMTHTTPFIRGVIALAEEHSFRICEVCGLPGKPSTVSGVVATTCPLHYEESIKK